MDDSWRVRIGSSIPRRRSTDFTSKVRPLADDFRDVFGGPPRSAFLHPDSPGLSSPPSFYDEIFQLPSDVDPPPHLAKSKPGRSLPVFRIPDPANPNRHRYHYQQQESEGRFYDDIFGSREYYEYECGRSRSRSGSMSKSNTSSSVLSSEEVSPIRTMPTPLDDGGFSSFASKLRPINVPCLSGRRSSTTVTGCPWRHWQGNSGRGGYSPHPPSWGEEFVVLQVEPGKLEPSFATSPASCYNLDVTEHSNVNPSPETVNLETSPQRSCVKIPSATRDFQATTDSPSSLFSSFDRQQLPIISGAENINPDTITAVENDDHEGEDATAGGEEEEAEEEEEGAHELLLGSYVIEIGCENRRDAETEMAVGVDEAIAWARQKAGTRASDQKAIDNGPDPRHNLEATLTALQKESSRRHPTLLEIPLTPEPLTQLRKEYTETHFLLAEVSKELKKWESGQGPRKSQKDMTMELLEEDISQWSSGKEGNIRSLLSTLQYILWPDSGWLPIPLSELIDISQVRKAYQKARLCLHPDKLQQKGATTAQTFIAEKIFALLQDAWATFNSLDICVG